MNRSLKHIYRRLCILLCLICFIFIHNQKCFAQKYSFSHYDIEDGLIESQANKLCQDNAHRLWIATLGGVSRFDGKEYYSISKANGLPDNFMLSIYADKKGLVWFGTDRGLLCLENGKIFNYPYPPGIKGKLVIGITEDGNGTIWAVMGRNLFRIDHRRMVMVKVVADQPEFGINNIATDNYGHLYAAVYTKGIYYLNKNTWISYAPFPKGPLPFFIRKIVFDKFDRHRLFILTPMGIYSAVDGVIKPLDEPALKQIKEAYLSLEQDAAGNLWIGTTNGAYTLNNHQLIHFTSHNGFTNNSVTDILNDSDNNLWLGTSGNGFFKYEQDNYVTFDQSQGIANSPVVMAMARDRNNDVVLGTDGGDLMKFKDGKLIALHPSPKVTGTTMIGCLYTDKRKNLWVSTESNGIWKYSGNNIQQIKGSETISVHDIVEDSHGIIWLASDRGCYYLKNDSLKYLPGTYTFVTSLLVSGKDSILVGLVQGVRLIVNGKMLNDFKLNALSTSSILCMLKIKDHILFGTDDKGLFIMDQKTGAIKNLTIKDGLKSYIIYSLMTDKNGVIWVGTGRGVNRIFINPENMAFTISDDGNSRTPIVEANQNSILVDGDKVLIGTTKGLRVYNTSFSRAKPTAPYILIQSVKLFPQDKTQNQDITNKKGDGATLSSGQNHISISFLGVYLKNPESISYQYKLTGLDSKFGLPVKNNVVDYSSLPPGKYTFEVRAVTDHGLVSKNTASFSFEIIPPFYKTIPFQSIAVLFFVLMGIAVQNFFHQRKLRNQWAIETMRREEKAKIRQQTAEDFHDDLGNKLTRITVLTEILNAKIDIDKTDQRNIVDQIKQNVAALYNGTKEILWALDPKSDNLYEVLMHLKDVGIDLFQDTPVSFQFDEIDDVLKNVKLTMEYSRNITMIFKELLNNVLKHANATVAVLNVVPAENNGILISLTDNGKGFDQEKIKKGYGVNNIRTRAKRINSELNIFSKCDIGTTVELKFGKI